jgi:hypothetical protein
MTPAKVQYTARKSSSRPIGRSKRSSSRPSMPPRPLGPPRPGRATWKPGGARGPDGRGNPSGWRRVSRWWGRAVEAGWPASWGSTRGRSVACGFFFFFSPEGLCRIMQYEFSCISRATLIQLFGWMQT